MIQTKPLHLFRLSSKNVRKKAPSKAYIVLLAASIVKDGLLQNLVAETTESEMLDVTAGGCRLMAMQLLLENQQIANDYPVPVQIKEPGSVGASLKENYLRTPMHPVDEYEAFAALHDTDHLTAKEIAADYGVSLKHVKQRLRLAGVHPTLRDECRNGSFDLDVLMAFAITEDHVKQWQVWEAAKGRHINAYGIREAMTAGAIDKQHPWVKLVGAAAYKKAGGVISTDLFEDNTYYENPEILRQLVDDRLNAEAAKFDGWQWLRVDLEVDYPFRHKCTQLPKVATAKSDKLQEKVDLLTAEFDQLRLVEEPTEEQEARWDALDQELDQLDEQIDAAKAVPKNAKQLSGVYIYIDRAGEIVANAGLIRPDDAKSAKRAGQSHSVDQTADAEGNTDIEAAGYSRALTDDAWAYRLAATKVAHAQLNDFDTVFNLLLCELIKRNEMAWHQSALTLRTENTFKESSRSDIGNSQLAGILAQTELEALVNVPTGADFADLYRAVAGLDQACRQRLFAVLMAKSITFTSGSGGHLPFLESVLGADLRAYWRPTAENLFSRVTIKDLLAWGPEVFMGSWGGRGHEKLSKKDLVKLFQAFFNDSDDTKLTAEQQQVKSQWLPSFMRPNLATLTTQEGCEA